MLYYNEKDCYLKKGRNKLRLINFQFDKPLNLSNSVSFILCPVDIREKIESIYLYSPLAGFSSICQIILWEKTIDGFNVFRIVSEEGKFVSENSILFDAEIKPESLKTLCEIDDDIPLQYYLGINFLTSWKRKRPALLGKTVKFIISSSTTRK